MRIYQSIYLSSSKKVYEYVLALYTVHISMCIKYSNGPWCIQVNLFFKETKVKLTLHMFCVTDANVMRFLHLHQRTGMMLILKSLIRYQEVLITVLHLCLDILSEFFFFFQSVNLSEKR